ncbi:MAG: DUF2061 domain-containing protein [Alphaproteobacteria bacterium]|nr:DUF2061 domain-containing protein [Alphaproteobacteria bacterium]
MRIFAKTASYAVMHVVVAFGIGYVVSGDVHIALGISLLEPFVQVICFAGHEHVWEKLRPGSSQHTPSSCCADAGVVAAVMQSFKNSKA